MGSKNGKAAVYVNRMYRHRRIMKTEVSGKVTLATHREYMEGNAVSRSRDIRCKVGTNHLHRGRGESEKTNTAGGGDAVSVVFSLGG